MDDNHVVGTTEAMEYGGSVQSDRRDSIISKPGCMPF